MMDAAPSEPQEIAPELKKKKDKKSKSNDEKEKKRRIKHEQEQKVLLLSVHKLFQTTPAGRLHRTYAPQALAEMKQRVKDLKRPRFHDDDACLLRFIRARKCDVDKATRLFEDCLVRLLVDHERYVLTL